MSETIRIVASSDEAYAPHLGVMFSSLLANARAPERLHLYVIDGGIMESTQQLLQAVAQGHGAQLEFFTLRSNLYDSYPLVKSLTPPAYYRLSIPELFPLDVKKALYLDCDLIVRADIQEVWDVPVTGFALAAVENISNSTYRRSGVPQDEYFNSGVMLLNLEEWRSADLATRVRAQIAGPKPTTDNDQCALNIVLHRQWKRLPLTWNFQSGMYRPHEQLAKYTETEVRQALQRPAIIHFVGWSKPWKYLCYHPLRQEYLRYREKTPWAHLPLEGDTLGNRVRGVTSPSLLKKLFRKKKWEFYYRQHGIIK